MATEYAIKFYKKAFAQIGTASAEAALSFSNSHAGAICFDTTTRQIYVGGAAYGGAVSDANYANGVLTITKSNGTQQTLDFNDVASADATLKVFKHMNTLMGVTEVGTTTELSYSGTNYLGTGIDTLVDADKTLDAQIKAVNDRIDGLDVSNVDTVNIANETNGDKTFTFNGVSQTNGLIEVGTVGENVLIKKVAFTGKAEDVAIDDTNNKFNATNVESALEELKDAITGANITIDGHKGLITSDTNTMVPVGTDGGKIGVKTDNVYIGSGSNGVTLLHVDTDASSNTGSDLATVNTVTAHISTAIDALDVTAYNQAEIVEDAIHISNIKEENGKIGSTAYTTINVDGTVSESNPLVTKDSISTAINALDVAGYEQASVTTSTITIYGIKEDGGKIAHDSTNDVKIAIAGGYNETTNKVATEKTVTDAVEALDTQADVQPVVYTAAAGDNGAKLTFKGVSETDGVIAQGSGSGELQFAKVATTGSASDVSVTYTVGTNENASSLQAAVNDIDSRLDSLETLPTFDTVVCSTANNTPKGITWGTNPEITGNLTASDDTMHKIYLVPATGTPTAPNSYAEYITVKDGNNYKWEKVGDTATDLTGYVKTVNVNGKEFSVTNNTTSVNLGDSITSITDGDETVTTSNGFTHDYVDSEVTVTSTKDSTNGTYAASVISTATVKVQAVGTSGDNAKGLAEASDVKAYVGTQISNLKVNETTVGTNVKVTYSETNGLVTINTTEEYATIGSDLSVTNGSKLVTGNDITKVKEYISTQVSDAVEALDVNDTTVSNTNISFHYREDDGKVSIGTLNEKYATVEQTGNATTTAPNLTVSGDTTGLVKGTDIETVKTYVDNKVGYEINRLDSIGTSAATGAVAQVVVEEADGKIGTVTVTNISAGVTVSTATPSLSASNTTGAVTGADIALIKDYVDAQAAQSAAVVDTLSTITVNSGEQTQIATIGGTPIKSAVSLVWEEYE